MRIKKISSTVGLTINTGNYSSGRIELSAEADVDLDLESSAGAQASLTEALKQRIVAQVSSVKEMSRKASGG